MTKILLVDDDAELLDMAKRRLSRKGFHVLVATQLSEVRDYLKNTPDIQAIICDLFLSHAENGLSFYIDELRNKFKFKFILATGDDTSDPRIDVLVQQDVLFACIQKPYCIDDVVQLINQN
ncbi:MAG: response regulator [Silvanigrellaceae bacterium]|nr:response regulator [Silvanigrellaceae bacterium]